jgi:hypothetical protein
MPVITPEEFSEFINDMNSRTDEQSWTKPEIRAAVQAIEDFFALGATRQTIAGKIEEVAPGVFNGQQKELIFALWCKVFARRTGLT